MTHLHNLAKEILNKGVCVFLNHSNKEIIMSNVKLNPIDAEVSYGFNFNFTLIVFYISLVEPYLFLETTKE